jgi:CHAT domain-containing protein/Tfp pilus assembly protein PilF
MKNASGSRCLHRAIRFSLLIRVVFCLALASSGSLCRGQDPRATSLRNAITQAEQHQKQNKFREAANEYAKAREIAGQIFGTNHINTAAFLQAEGMLHRQMGDFTKAESLISQGLRIAESARDAEFAAEAINNLATVKWEQGAFSDALALHERGLALLVRSYGESSVPAAVSRGNLGGVYKSLGEYTQAEPLILQSVKVLRANQPKSALELASGLMNLADLYALQGNFPRSELLLLEAIQINERTLGSNHFEVARTRNNLGAIYSTMGQFEKAESLQKQVVKSLELALGADHPDVARVLHNLAIAYQQQKRYSEAEPIYQRVLAIRQKTVGMEHPDTALTKHNMAGFYTELKDYPQAMALYEEALSIRRASLGIDHPSVAFSLMAMGKLEHRQRRPENSRERYDEALQIRQKKLSPHHPDLAYTHNGLAEIDASAGKWESSVEHFDLARRGFRRHVDQVLPSLSEADQLKFLKYTEEPHFHTALSLVLAQPENQQIIDQSASWVLNGKAVSQQALAQRALVARDTTNPQLASIVKSLLFIRKQLASLTMISETTLDDSERLRRIDELTKLEQTESQKLAEQGGRSLGSGAWIETNQIRQSLQTDSVLVEIARFKQYEFDKPGADIEELSERYVAWIIPPTDGGKIMVVDLGDTTAIDEQVRSVRTALKDAPELIREQGEPDAEQIVAPVLKNLATKILYPLLSAVEPHQTIYLSPDSLLWLVPWSALPLDNGQYAIENFDIRFVVTGRDLVRSDSPLKVGLPIIFADPDYNLDPAAVETATQQVLGKSSGDRNALRAVTPFAKFKLGTAERLPGTKAEADAVLPQLEIFTAAKASVYTGKWALEAIFKALHQPRVLVLSTHGFFEEEESFANASQTASNPLLRCGLLLAGCNKPIDTSRVDGEDGILTGLEIVSADLRGTELVVLSACETGLGEVRNGEGVAGLRQAFQLAGARSVVSTLWQIPDRETAKLMAKFFTGLAQSNDKADSLRASQLQLIETRRDRNGAAHPFFWAAFTITGE